jgi:hypothetical protein
MTGGRNWSQQQKGYVAKRQAFEQHTGQFLLSFRGATARIRNVEMPGSVLTHRHGMTE